MGAFLTHKQWDCRCRGWLIARNWLRRSKSQPPACVKRDAVASWIGSGRLYESFENVGHATLRCLLKPHEACLSLQFVVSAPKSEHPYIEIFSHCSTVAPFLFTVRGVIPNWEFSNYCTSKMNGLKESWFITTTRGHQPVSDQLQLLDTSIDFGFTHKNALNVATHKSTYEYNRTSADSCLRDLSSVDVISIEIDTHWRWNRSELNYMVGGMHTRACNRICRTSMHIWDFVMNCLRDVTIVSASCSTQICICSTQSCCCCKVSRKSLAFKQIEGCTV